MTTMLIFIGLILGFIILAGCREFFNKDNEIVYSMIAVCVLVVITSGIIVLGNKYKIQSFKAEIESFSIDYHKINEINIKNGNQYMSRDYYDDIIEINKRITREKQYITAPWIIRDFVDLKIIATLKPIDL